MHIAMCICILPSIFPERLIPGNVPPLLPSALAGSWTAALPRLLPFLRADMVPLSGPMLGCSAIYASGGAPLAKLDREQEAMALVQLPLLESAGVSGAAAPGSVRLAHTPLASVLGAAAAASADAGPAAPYAAYPGGYVVEPVSWEVRVRRGQLGCPEFDSWV